MYIVKCCPSLVNVWYNVLMYSLRWSTDIIIQNGKTYNYYKMLIELFASSLQYLSMSSIYSIL